MAAVPLANNLALGVVRDDTTLAILVNLCAQDGVGGRIVCSRYSRRSAILALPLVGTRAAKCIIISSIITLLVAILSYFALIP